MPSLLLLLLLLPLLAADGAVASDEVDAGPPPFWRYLDGPPLDGLRIFPSSPDGGPGGPGGPGEAGEGWQFLQQGPVTNVSGPQPQPGPREGPPNPNVSQRLFPFFQAAMDAVLIGNCTDGPVLLDKVVVVGPAANSQSQTFLFNQPAVLIRCVKLVSRNPGFNGQAAVLGGGPGTDFVVVKVTSLAWFRSVWRIVVIKL